MKKENNFAREIAKYYMNFLKTGFKTRKYIPKRQTTKTSFEGELVGVNLEKYNDFLLDFKQKINTKIFDEYSFYEVLIPKNKYVTPKISEKNLDRIKLWVSMIVPKYLDEIYKTKIEKEIMECVLKIKANSFSWKNNFLDRVRKVVAEKLYIETLIKIKEETEIESIFKKNREEYNPNTILEYIKPLISEKIDETAEGFIEEAEVLLKKNQIIKTELDSKSVNTKMYDDNRNSNDVTSGDVEQESNINFISVTNNNSNQLLNNDENKELKIDYKKYYNTIKRTFNQILLIDSINKAIKEVLSNNNLFTDISKMQSSQNRRPNQAFYFYCGEIKFQKWSFPVLYMKIDVSKKNNSYSIKFINNSIYVNKTALEFVDKKLGKIFDKEERIELKNLNRIFKFDENKSLQKNLDPIYKNVKELFEYYFEKDIRENPDLEMKKKYFLWVFDQGDESLINDYEKIMETDELLEKFAHYISGYLSIENSNNEKINDDTDSFMEKTNVEVDNDTLSKKLLFRSPVPLNKEQRQVIDSIHNDEHHLIAVEGPPGTGKSHLITSIAFDSIIKKKNCLILSDTKEALDVVERKIEQEFEKIPNYKENGNLLEVLRIGKKGRNATKIIKKKNKDILLEIGEGWRRAEKKLENAIQKLTNDLNEELEEYKKIDYDKINSYLTNYKDLKNNHLEDFELLKEWFPTKKEFEIGIVQLYEAIKGVSDAGLNLKQIPQHWIEKNKNLESAFKNVNKFYKSTQDDEMDTKEKICKDIYNNISYNEDFNSDFFLRWSRIIKLIKKNKFNKQGLKLTLDSDFTDAKKQLRLANFLYVTLKNWFKFKWNKKKKCHSKKWKLNEETKINTIESFIDTFEKAKKLKSSDFPNNVPQELMSILKHEGKLRNKDFNDFKRFIEVVVFFFSNVSHELNRYFANEELMKTFNKIKKLFFPNFFGSDSQIKKRSNLLDELKWLVKKLKKIKKLSVIDYEEKVNLEEIDQKLTDFKSLINNYIKLQNKIKQFISDINDLSSEADDSKYNEDNKLPSIYDFQIFNFRENNAFKNISSKDDSIFINHSAYFEWLLLEYEKILKISNNLKFLLSLKTKHKEVLSKIKVELGNEHLINLLWNAQILNINKEVLKKYEIISESYYCLADMFPDVYKSSHYKKNLENIYKYTREQMFSLLAKRLHSFLKVKEALEIRKKINASQELDNKEFQLLSKGFPCIIASIREYAEVIPLKENIFDLVVIDEASQVSTAQALTAIFRAKKVVILGDEQQFSNVSSSQAKTELNDSLIEQIKKIAPEKIGHVNIKKDKLKNFNVKNSILDFLEEFFDKTIKLRNQFRSFPEIISFSNKYFYENQLNYLKLRDRPIEDIIKFDIVPESNVKELNKGKKRTVNIAECKMIIEKINELLENGFKGSIGVITPHKDQQKLIYGKIKSEKNFLTLLESPFNLKIMTFDTCQGEERDYVFYSMVERENTHTLIHIFHSDSIDHNRAKSDDKLKKGGQRLNVGFSRAKDCMHFILSKEVKDFQKSGAIFHSINHYYDELIKSKDKVQTETNISQSENIIFNKIKKTNFYNEKQPTIEIQDKIGKYFKSMYKSKNTEYIHPEYRHTFLMVTKDRKKIMLEYDAFENAKAKIKRINSDEIELQKRKELESYGYRFINLNEFILGKNPLSKLNDILLKVVK